MKFKFKFNFKLIIAMLSLFSSLILVILGSKNNYCLSFGFMLLGISIELFMIYLNEKYKNELIKLAEEIDEVDTSEDLDEEEKVYILQQLYLRQKHITKKNKRTNFVFATCGALMILLGVFNLF